MSGKIIVFDGPDGVGKTTQLKLTASWLEGQGYKVYATRASGGTPIGEELRKVSLSDVERPPEVDVYISLAMHTALGMDLATRKVHDAICLVDRSPMAVIAYNTFGSELKDQQMGYDAFDTLMERWSPDLLLMINADQAIIDKRRQARTEKPADYFEKKGAAYHQRVREGYEKAAELTKQKGINLQHIDGAPSEEVVQQSIQKAVSSVLG
jgi:dTMP kinase